MQDVGCVHIHMKMLYYSRRGDLEIAWFFAPTLPILVSVIGGRGESDNAWFLVTTLSWSVFVFCVFNDSLLALSYCVFDDSLPTLSDCVGEIGHIIKEMRTLRGKKYGSLIFNPVCPAFPRPFWFCYLGHQYW